MGERDVWEFGVSWLVRTAAREPIRRRYGGRIAGEPEEIPCIRQEFSLLMAEELRDSCVRVS